MSYNRSLLLLLLRGAGGSYLIGNFRLRALQPAALTTKFCAEFYDP
jgi:hypothetical protein